MPQRETNGEQDRRDALKNWVKPALSRLVAGSAENGPAEVSADGDLTFS
jgi:hypothetical protein